MTLLTLTPALLSRGTPAVQNIIDQLPNHSSKKYLKRDLAGVKHFVVHHMASEAALINQATYHVNGRGWPRIGYHIVIANGMIYQTNYLDTESYHTSGYNRISIGIAILGDLSNRSITQRERELLAAVLVSLKAIVPGADILGHNQLTATACPSTDMNVIRGDVMTLEMELEQAASPVKKEELAFRMANQILYYYNMFHKGVDSRGNAVTDGQRQWALSQMMLLEPDMRRYGMLK